MTDNYQIRDATLIKTKALPNGAAAVNSDGLDVGLRGARGALLEDCELEIVAPILTTTELPDTKTMTYKVVCDADVAFGSPKTLGDGVLVQLGAGGTGAAAATARFRLPTDCEQYVRVTATNSGTGNASGKSMTVALKF